MSLDTLPIELLHMIMDFSNRKTVKSLRLVSRTFNCRHIYMRVFRYGINPVIQTIPFDVKVARGILTQFNPFKPRVIKVSVILTDENVRLLRNSHIWIQWQQNLEQKVWRYLAKALWFRLANRTRHRQLSPIPSGICNLVKEMKRMRALTIIGTQISPLRSMPRVRHHQWRRLTSVNLHNVELKSNSLRRFLDNIKDTLKILKMARAVIANTSREELLQYLRRDLDLDQLWWARVNGHQVEWMLRWGDSDGSYDSDGTDDGFIWDHIETGEEESTLYVRWHASLQWTLWLRHSPPVEGEDFEVKVRLLHSGINVTNKP